MRTAYLVSAAAIALLGCSGGGSGSTGTGGGSTPYVGGWTTSQEEKQGDSSTYSEAFLVFTTDGKYYRAGRTIVKAGNVTTEVLAPCEHGTWKASGNDTMLAGEQVTFEPNVPKKTKTTGYKMSVTVSGDSLEWTSDTQPTAQRLRRATSAPTFGECESDSAVSAAFPSR